MKFLKTSLIITAMSAASAIPAFAHAGSHEASFLATALHWLASPTHAALAVIGSVAIIALIIRFKRT